MNKKIYFHKKALNDLEEYSLANDEASLQYIKLLIEDIAKNGDMEGIGNPEQMTKELSGWYSRRISWRNRLVYRTAGNEIHILYCKDHYKIKN